MDDLLSRLSPGDNSEKFDIPSVDAVPVDAVTPEAAGLAMPVATAPDTSSPAPVGEERPLTPAEALVNPDLLRQCRDKVREFSTMAATWKGVKEINSPVLSAQLNDFMTGARGVFKTVDALRKEAKRPFDENAAKVQELFANILAEITRTVDAVKPMQEKWLTAESARIAAEKAALVQAAAEAKRKAEDELSAAQARDDIGAQVEAEAAHKAAEKLEKVASRPAIARAGSASGGGKSQGLRRQPVVELVGMMAAFNHFKAAPELAACLTQLATAAARSAGVDAIDKGDVKIPGFNISTKEVL
jgi:hypothetical protein